MMHVGVLGVLFSFVRRVNEKLETMRIEIPFHQGVQVLFVQSHELMYRAGKRVQQDPAFIALNCNSVLRASGAHVAVFLSSDAGTCNRVSKKGTPLPARHVHYQIRNTSYMFQFLC